MLDIISDKWGQTRMYILASYLLETKYKNVWNMNFINECKKMWEEESSMYMIRVMSVINFERHDVYEWVKEQTKDQNFKNLSELENYLLEWELLDKNLNEMREYIGENNEK